MKRLVLFSVILTSGFLEMAIAGTTGFNNVSQYYYLSGLNDCKTDASCQTTLSACERALQETTLKLEQAKALILETQACQIKQETPNAIKGVYGNIYFLK